MANVRIDPGLSSIGFHCVDEEAAIGYAQELGLLPGPTPAQVNAFNAVLQGAHGRGMPPRHPPIGTCWKPPCNGNVILAITQRTGGSKLMYRCSTCKSLLSGKVGSLNRYLEYVNGPQPRPRPLGTWFSSISAAGIPKSKLPTKEVLLITWCWAQDLNIRQTMRFLKQDFPDLCKKTVIDWRNFCRDLCVEARDVAPKMGGVNEIVQIDESYMAYRRKNNVGRLGPGNDVPGRGNNNHGQRADGSKWVFGLVWFRPDGKEELRPFKVPRRDANTLIPIIQDNVTQGTTIYSDEWAAYQQLNGSGYRHETVNHSVQFINTLPTGKQVHTQRIESRWGRLKLKVMKNMRGTSRAIFDSHMAEAWWRSLHALDRDPVFLEFVDLIKKKYPML